MLAPPMPRPVPPVTVAHDPLSDDGRWEAVLRRDRTADGRFWYAVRTTGVYCRPSCAARPARRENVSFHASPAAARAAGFRACKRCRPDEAGGPDPRAALVAAACRRIEEAEEPPTLEMLATAAGVSPFHFHRIFKAVTGVTPKAYAMAHRTGRVRRELGNAETVTAAIYDAGFNASSRFYESSTGRLGMTPSAWRAGGVGAAIRFAVGDCPLGSVLVAATDKGVCAIELGDDPQALLDGLQRRFPKATLVGADADFEATVAAVLALVEAPGRASDLPLDIRGTAFQERVWRALRDIPAGRTATYAEIAAAIGQPRAVRAVANACGANPTAIAIPCHRVVRTDGDPGGYRWGIDRKQALLRREAAGE